MQVEERIAIDLVVLGFEQTIFVNILHSYYS